MGADDSIRNQVCYFNIVVELCCEIMFFQNQQSVLDVCSPYVASELYPVMVQ
jgi:hypothetical protein